MSSVGFIKERDLTTRPLMVAAIAAGWKQPEGHVINVAGLNYAFKAGATDIADLLGLVPSGVVRPEHFGAKGDGTTDDTTAMQAFFTWFAAARLLAPTKARIWPGRYRLTNRVVCTVSSSGYRSVLDWDGAEFVCDFNRTTAAELLYFGNPASPASYQGPIDFKGRVKFTRGAGCTFAPVGVRIAAAAQTKIDGINGGSWNNVLVDLWGPQNVECSDWTIYSSGYSFAYEDTGSSLFRQTGTTLARVSGTYSFPTHVVGKTIEITAGAASRKVKITAWISTTQVTVETTVTDTVDQAVYLGSPAPKTVSGSAAVVLDGPVTTDMVGLFVGIPGAGANSRILWATITAVNTGTSTITLDRNASVTLNPTTTPLTQTTEIATPAVVIRSDKASEGGLFSNGISQMRFNNLQIESYYGIAVGIDDAENLHFTQAKMHGLSTPSGTLYSVAHIWGNTIGGSFIGEYDQRTMGRYKMQIGYQTQAFNFLSLNCRTRLGELLLAIWPNVATYTAAEVNFGAVCLNGIDDILFSALIDDKTSTGGYVPPTTLFIPLAANARVSMGKGVYNDNDGKLFAASLSLTATPIPFTPVVADASTGGNVATCTANGVYERIGNQVRVSMRIIGITTTGMTAGNPVYIRGLPIAVRTGTFSVLTAPARMNNITFAAPPVAFADDGDTFILFYVPVSGGAATLLTVAGLTSGTADILIQINYLA